MCPFCLLPFIPILANRCVGDGIQPPTPVRISLDTKISVSVNALPLPCGQLDRWAFPVLSPSLKTQITWIKEQAMSLQFTRRTFGVVSAVLLVTAGLYQRASGEGIPLKRDQKVRVMYGNGSGLYPQIGYFVGINQGKLYMTSRGEFSIDIDRVMTNSGDTVNFPYAGARYNAATDTLTGVTSKGDTVSLALDDVTRIEVQYFTKDVKAKTTFDRHTVRSRLRYGAKYPDLKTVPVDSIRRLEVWHESSTIAPFLGMVVGGIAGYFAAEAAYTPSDDPWEDAFRNELTKGGTGKVIFVVTGVIAGGLVGGVIGRGHWKEVEIKGPRVSIAPVVRDGPGLSLAVKF